jgi:hypothetical protein
LVSRHLELLELDRLAAARSQLEPRRRHRRLGLDPETRRSQTISSSCTSMLLDLASNPNTCTRLGVIAGASWHPASSPVNASSRPGGDGC